MSLQKKLTRWKEENLLTQEQYEKILAFERQRTGNTFWHTAFIMAGLLIGLGVCLLVASNWDALGTLAKVVGDFAILGALFYTTWWCVMHERKGLSELFAIFSFLMIGATIGLLGQVFNLEGGWRSFACAWAILGLPFVIISRSMFFNVGWLCLFFSIFNTGWMKEVLEHIFKTFDGAAIAFVAVLCLLSYAGKKLDETAHPYTLLPKAFSKLALWFAYFFTWILGMHWGTRTFLHSPDWMTVIMANLFVFIFFGARMFLAIKAQNIVSFRRNAISTELYIFVLFASCFGSLFLSGLGFIGGGLAVLGLVYVLRRTSRYIKNMGEFK